MGADKLLALGKRKHRKISELLYLTYSPTSLCLSEKLKDYCNKCVNLSPLQRTWKIEPPTSSLLAAITSKLE